MTALVDAERHAPKAARLVADVDAVYRVALAEMRAQAHVPKALVGLVDKVLSIPAKALARSLGELDADLSNGAFGDAGLRRLRHYGVDAKWDVGSNAPLRPIDDARTVLPATGPLLVVSNHPGLYDCLALFAAVGRDDLRVIAAARPLFEGLPNLSARMLFLSNSGGAFAVRTALRHLAQGGAVLHFPAGEIEPDPRLVAADEPPLGVWKPGLETLIEGARRVAPTTRVVSALVSGVISRRARAVARLFARRGATDAIVPLLELTFRVFGDVDVRVRFGKQREAKEAGLVAALHVELLGMAHEAQLGNAGNRAASSLR